ncbi:right-handed parallel beta-helix repeat-containing protein [Alkalihalophilus marmarensis]|uniref:right-handed parallel beta-helix repeat-containing protein n=1 Tax=Alkalihalophilus marmarensis TaxID=521377 RepID=UPI002E1BAAB3|nr:right-handed parallel beta-helix repeat-containing protein [Alkalihalophilus marmarensis]
MTLYNIDNPLSDDGRNKMNSMFQELYQEYKDAGMNASEAREKAIQAVTEATTAKQTAELTRQEMVEIIREQTQNGDLAPEIAQARGTHSTVGERLTKNDEQLAHEAQQTRNEFEQRGVNVRWFSDLENDGDFSPVIQAAMDTGFSIIEFPNWIKTLKTPVVVPNTVKEIRFNKAVLLYEKEQVLNLYGDSMFVVDGTHDLKVSGGKAEYLGTFDLGASYSGKISAFHVTNSNNFRINGFESTKFNNCGINIAPSKTSAYCNNPTIENCNLHHNRVAGLAFGNTNNLLANDNTLEFNGIESDPLTGYGLAGWRDAYPKNTIVKNNKANYNYRKGIDFHSGFNGVIDKNFCIGNRIYGIFVVFDNEDSEGNVREIGDWKITNNIIQDMSLDNTSLFSTIYGLVIGSYKNQPSGRSASFMVSGNSINGFDTSNNAIGFPVYVVSTGFRKAKVDLISNTVVAGAINSFVRFQEDTGLSSGHTNASISNNSFSCTTSKESAFAVRSNSRVKVLAIDDNEVSIEQTYTPISLCNYADSNANTLFTDSSFTFHDNKLFVVKPDWGNFDIVLIYGRNNITLRNNFWNGVRYRDWDGRRYILTNTTFNVVGNWTRGSFISNSTPSVFGSAGSRYTVSGWLRITNGTANTLNDDWFEMRNPTGT